MKIINEIQNYFAVSICKAQQNDTTCVYKKKYVINPQLHGTSNYLIEMLQ